MQNINEFDEENNIKNECNFPEEQPKKRNPVRTQLLTIIQLMICILIIVGAFVIKNIGGDLYASIGTWFFDNYNNSIFTGTADSPLSFIDKTVINEVSRHSDNTVPKKPENFEESKT